MTSSERPGEHLPAPTRRLHRALLDGLLTTGTVPPTVALADIAGVSLADLPARLRELAVADYAAFNDAGRLICLYPFSPGPTSHVVVINGQRRSAMCAIDALGIPAMLGQALAIEARCAVCGIPLRLDVAPGTLERVRPRDVVVVAHTESERPACEVCCPFTVFACGQAHAQELLARLPGTRVLSLHDAQVHGERIFGDFLAAQLPSQRRRSSMAPLKRA